MIQIREACHPYGVGGFHAQNGDNQNMPKLIARTRIIKIPQSKSLQGGRLDSIRLESVGRRRDLVMDFQGFIPSVPSLLLMEHESLYERLEGHFIPRRLRFMGITIEF
jgi:hypothetical protein